MPRLGIATDALSVMRILRAVSGTTNNGSYLLLRFGGAARLREVRVLQYRTTSVASWAFELDEPASLVSTRFSGGEEAPSLVDAERLVCLLVFTLGIQVWQTCRIATQHIEKMKITRRASA